MTKVKKHSKVNSLDELKAANSGDVYFYDEDSGIVFLRYKGSYQRKAGQVSSCGQDMTACINKVCNKMNM